jgi:uncharacterized RDD family membrane protein YckC
MSGARPPEQPGLFDLPLRPPADDDGAAERLLDPDEPELDAADDVADEDGIELAEAGIEAGDAAEEEAAAPDDDFFAEPAGDRPAAGDLLWDEPAAQRRPRPAPLPPREPLPGPRAVPDPPPEPRRPPGPAGFGPRLIADLIDTGVVLATLAAGAFGALGLGVALDTSEVPAFALFGLVFSFLYTVVTLAFWGSTPGMAAVGLVARSGRDQPLSFGQTGLRWLAGLATVALCGLPLVVALTGRSLADRLSGSMTLENRR